MYVKVIGLGATSGSTEVDPDVDTVATQARFEYRHRCSDQLPQFCELVRSKVLEVGHGPVGQDHQMTRGVGEPV